MFERNSVQINFVDINSGYQGFGSISGEIPRYKPNYFRNLEDRIRSNVFRPFLISRMINSFALFNQFSLEINPELLIYLEGGSKGILLEAQSNIVFTGGLQFKLRYNL